MSTFAAPLRVFGKTKEGPAADVGQVLAMQEADISFSDSGATDAFILPPNAVPVEFYIDTTTLFDAATTIDVGTTGTGDAFTTGATVTTVGRVLGSADASQIVNYVDVGDVAVQVTYELTTAATAGAAKLRCLYWINQNLPT